MFPWPRAAPVALRLFVQPASCGVMRVLHGTRPGTQPGETVDRWAAVRRDVRHDGAVPGGGGSKAAPQPQTRKNAWMRKPCTHGEKNQDEAQSRGETFTSSPARWLLLPGTPLLHMHEGVLKALITQKMGQKRVNFRARGAAAAPDKAGATPIG